jgi:hypothetical protein
MFGNKSRRDDARRRLLEDIDRAHGYMSVIVEEARRLRVDVPGAIVVCVDNWSGWHRSLARRALDPPQDEE